MLEVIGAVLVTLFVLWWTWGSIVIFFISDYGPWDTLRWNWKDLWWGWVVNVILLIGWWFLVGNRLTIGLD